MKTRTSDFKNQIKELGREISNKIGMYGNDCLLATEDDKLILTQDDIKLIAFSKKDEIYNEIDDKNIFNVSVIQKGSFLSTMMKELDFESDIDFKLGTIANYKFGLKVNGNYEYLDYGNFIIYKKEFNEDTKHYVYTCYDAMLKTMVMVGDTSIIQNVDIQTAIENIADKFGLEVDIDNDIISEYPNLEKTIADNTFNGMEITYRDVLEQICQAVGCSMYVDNNKIKFKNLNSSVVDTFDASYLKDANVTFKQKYGPVNSLVLSRSEDTDTIYSQDTSSIQQNGLCEYKIKDNLILNGNDREEYIDNIFDQIKGVEFYINDYESTGICYLDWLDFYNITIGVNSYKCLMLNDEIKIKSGISETIYAEQPEETVTDYTTSGKTDKEVSFIVDKQNASINAKVSKGDVINEINLDESGVSINASKVNLTGYITATDLAGNGTTTINGSNITTGTIDANIVNVTNVVAASVAAENITGTTISGKTINGGSVNLTSNNNNPKLILSGTAYSGTSSINKLVADGLIINANSKDLIKMQILSGSNGYSGDLTLKHTGNNDFANMSSDGFATGTGSSPNAFMYSDGEVYARTYSGGSLESIKKNIELYKNNALNIINNSDIYEYNLKEEENNDKKHIGLIIADGKKTYNTPQEIITKKGDSIDLYSMISLSWKALQEQQKQIEKLKKEIKLLKEDK